MQNEERERLIRLLEMIDSNQDGEALNAAKKAHQLVRAKGKTWHECIRRTIEFQEVCDIFLSVDRRLGDLRKQDQQSFLEIRQRYFEDKLSEGDFRQVKYYKTLLDEIPDDPLPF
jgi:hypothetical protein